MPFHGMPAYESERGALVVMENVLVFVPGADTAPLVLPLSYRSACIRAPDGLVALHDDPDAVWSWRPCLYTLGHEVEWRLSSQVELEYRIGVGEVALRGSEQRDRIADLALRILREEQAVRPGKLRKNAKKRLARRFRDLSAAILEETPELSVVEACERAGRLLLDCLSWQQRLDLLAGESFYCRGEINRLYEVVLGEGFYVVDPATRQRLVSFCLHPEEWLPHADVALATKLGIEAGRDTEEELLAAANPTTMRGRTRPTEGEAAALRLERRYLADV
jgi:hypothetical protein